MSTPTSESRADLRAVRNDIPRLIEVITTLGERNVDVLDAIKESNAEQRRTNVLVKIGIGVGVVLTVAFVAATLMLYAATKQLSAAATANRETLAREIDSAKDALAIKVARVEEAADRAASSAKRAAAESVVAQADVAEVQARVAPPRERDEAKRKVETRREKARELLYGREP